MKALDIYPTFCWSLQGFDSETIEQLRRAVAIPDENQRDEALARIAGGEAFRFVGDPTKLDFAAHFFDEVRLAFEPDESQRSLFQQCVRRWTKHGAGWPADNEPQKAPDKTSTSNRKRQTWRDRLFPRWAT